MANTGHVHRRIPDNASHQNEKYIITREPYFKNPFNTLSTTSRTERVCDSLIVKQWQ